MKQNAKEYINHLRDPWFWFLYLATMILSYTISHCTGWSFDDSITVVIGGFTLIVLVVTGVLLIRNKIKTGKWSNEN